MPLRLIASLLKRSLIRSPLTTSFCLAFFASILRSITLLVDFLGFPAAARIDSNRLALEVSTDGVCVVFFTDRSDAFGTVFVVSVVIIGGGTGGGGGGSGCDADGCGGHTFEESLFVFTGI